VNWYAKYLSQRSLCSKVVQKSRHTPQPFYGPFFRDHPVSRCQKRILGLYGAREDNRGRHTDHLAGHQSIRTNQCLPPPSPPYFFTGRMPFLSPNQQCQSTEGTQVNTNMHIYTSHRFLADPTTTVKEVVLFHETNMAEWF